MLCVNCTSYIIPCNAHLQSSIAVDMGQIGGMSQQSVWSCILQSDYLIQLYPGGHQLKSFSHKKDTKVYKVGNSSG